MRSTKSRKVALRARFQCPLLDRYSANNVCVCVWEGVGGKSVSHSKANALPFEEAVSHLRDAAVARLSPLRDMLSRREEGRRAGNFLSQVEEGKLPSFRDGLSWSHGTMLNT